MIVKAFSKPSDKNLPNDQFSKCAAIPRRKCWPLASSILLLSFLAYLTLTQEEPGGSIAAVWPPTQTRDAGTLIGIGKNTTILRPRHVCSFGANQTFLLVFVCSAVANFGARMAIRNSWAMDARATLDDVKVVFVLGEILNASIQERVELESEQFGDILQERFVDSYVNLTIKSLMLLKWFSVNCEKEKSQSVIEYVMKTDDDVYVNLVQLHHLVKSNSAPNLLLGSRFSSVVPVKDPYNKWYVPDYMFCGLYYPPYLSGTGYLMHRSTARNLLAKASHTPVFHLEDVYITGILAQKANIQPVNNQAFSYTRRPMHSCLFEESMTTHEVEHREMSAIYKKLQEIKNTSHCPLSIVNNFLITWNIFNFDDIT